MITIIFGLAITQLLDKRIILFELQKKCTILPFTNNLKYIIIYWNHKVVVGLF